MALLLLADWAVGQAGASFFPGAPLDESAHLLTALLLLQILPGRWRAGIAGPALLASVAIDLDHVPQYLGYQFLSSGTPRPYTHSLLTVVLLAGLAPAARRHRRLFAGLALGVVLHLFRDLGEGSGSAVPLLWPLRDRGYGYPHAAYLAMLVGVVTAQLGVAGRGTLSRRRRAEPRRRARRPRASRASA